MAKISGSKDSPPSSRILRKKRTGSERSTPVAFSYFDGKRSAICVTATQILNETTDQWTGCILRNPETTGFA